MLPAHGWEDACVYERILLAYDGSAEGRAALREGALVAKRCGAQVYLLSVVAEAPGVLLAEGVFAGPGGQEWEVYRKVLEDGVERLRSIGLAPVATMVTGEPAAEIGAYAKKIDADLVVVGHRRPKFLERWWSGSLGANLMDHTRCSLLISRKPITDEAFQAELARIGGRGG